MSVVSKRGVAVTIKDVARAAGVGLMTVSRVINGVPGNKFSQETALRVREAIHRLGYEPNHVARSLRGRKSGVIGVVTTSISDPFWASCARGVELEARKENYVPILVATDEDCLLEERRVAALQAHRVDGLLLVSTYRAHRTSLTTRLANIPTVAIDRPISGYKTDCVLIDNHEAAHHATRHLISHGHRRIAFLGYGERLYTVHERIEGYSRAMKEAGLECLVYSDAPDPAGAQSLAHRVLSAKHRPTAIFAANTMVMHGIMLAARDLGLNVPSDVALAGFEDFRWAGMVSPGLTVVRQPGEEMGRLAAQLLFERLAGKKGPPQRIMLDTELIIRESCGCGEPAVLTAATG
jgi:LacI family transcriptional regulator